MSAEFALLLPITSRGTGGLGVRSASELEEALRGFHASVERTTASEPDRGSTVKIFVGIDIGDPLLDKREPGGDDVVTQALEFAGIPFETVFCEAEREDLQVDDVTARRLAPAKGQVCRVWRRLAQAAFDQGAAYAVLVGDDVRLLSTDWLSEIRREFAQLHGEAFPWGCAEIPEGFGVLCFTDTTSPGFPGFPVLHRTHAEIFPEIFPQKFVNQDADPWLFQVYLRFGAARLMPHAKLENTVGGCAQQDDVSSRPGPRYSKVTVDWKTEILQGGVQKIRAWLTSRGGRERENLRFPRFVTLDVLVPTVRLDDFSVLRKICSLEVPRFMRTMFIIIVDDPSIPAGKIKELTDAIQLAAGETHVCRVRQNEENVGAGPSRNRALDESCADWALFLDDDVKPSKNLLTVYDNAIRDRTADLSSPGPRDSGEPAICGFVGNTQFPPAVTSLQHAIVLSDVTYMYGISKVVPYPAWGVTANLLVRVAGGGDRGDGLSMRTRFGDRFPKTGGGEDVDFCLRHQNNAKGLFAAVPAAVVIHPWWPGGRLKTYRRFAMWSFGDGQLIDLHPAFTYRNVPNVAESMLLALLLPLLLAVVSTVRSLGDNHGTFVGGSSTGAPATMGTLCPNSVPPPFGELLWIGVFWGWVPPFVASTLAAPLAVLLSEIVSDIIRNTTDNTRMVDRSPEVTGLARTFSAAELRGL